MDRLRNLESLVREIGGQLELANAATGSSANITGPVKSSVPSLHERGTDLEMSPFSTTRATGVQKQFGKLVVQDANKSVYIGSEFWSRVNDEVDALATPPSLSIHMTNRDVA
jgi:hypothetical protein